MKNSSNTKNIVVVRADTARLVYREPKGMRIEWYVNRRWRPWSENKWWTDYEGAQKAFWQFVSSLEIRKPVISLIPVPKEVSHAQA